MPVKKVAQPEAMIDSEIRDFIFQLESNYEKLTPIGKISPPQRRSIAEQARKPFTLGGPEMAQTETISLENSAIKARIYTPKVRLHFNSRQPVLLYLHGGGWVMFSIDTHDRLMREYAHQSGYTVIGIDYSLSPEHRFPQALDDIDTVYEWVISNADTYDWSPDEIFIGGDSAGGNLALCSTLRRRDKKQKMPQGLLLNYAALDTETRLSHNEFDGAPFVLTVDEMAAFWQDYLGASNTDNPYARPLLANLSELPPVHLCIAGCDILRDENLTLRDRLKEANVGVSSTLYQGATHSFLEAMSISSCARQAIRDASVWLNAAAKSHG